MQVKNCFLILLIASFAAVVSAQPRESVEGVHYQVLARQIPTETPEDVIEVRELFWYGCPECFTLEPLMTDWRDGVRGDLKMIRTPAVWNDLMALHARIYYTGIAIDAEDRIHQAAFRAIHEENNPLRTEAQIRELFLANAVDAETFDAAWNADEVISSVQQARLRSSEYGVDKLPSVILNGRYSVTHNEKVFNHIELNIAVNMVVRRLRDERRSDF
jgi:thiol:disulfide interchange protein DsbA